MKTAGWKRALLAGMMMLSVAGGSLTPVVAGHAAAASTSGTGVDQVTEHGPLRAVTAVQKVREAAGSTPVGGGDQSHTDGSQPGAFSGIGH